MEDIEQIRKYIQNQLSAEDKSNFEKKLDAEKGLRDEVEKERLIMKGIAFSERERLKSVLQRGEQTRSKYWYAVAALIPLLIISYLFIYDSPNANSIYTNFYEPYGVYEFGEVRGESLENNLEEEAFEAYKQGEYQEAYEKIKELQNASDRIGYDLYAGICLMELERFEEALNMFDQIPESSKYIDIGTWYQALVLIKLERIGEASELLGELSNGKNGLARRSKEVLDQL
ncbi:hypothetical protein [Ekhidna sp.]|uniref:hypothetical protein n=1 Tax=Ekhidna sp. TaxID=2608089 RepID=UPI003BABA876